jgi:para-nitrobenzyl esterase
VEPAKTLGVQLATRLEVDGIAGLLGMDPTTVAGSGAVSWCLPLGTIDGHVLPRQLVDVFDRGEQAHVPVLVGFNSGEVRSLPFLAPPPPATAVAYVTAVRDRYGPLADALLRLYPSSDIRGAYSPSRVTRSKSWTAERVATKQAAIGEYTILYFRSRLFRCGSRRAARLPRQ